MISYESSVMTGAYAIDYAKLEIDFMERFGSSPLSNFWSHIPRTEMSCTGRYPQDTMAWQHFTTKNRK